MKVLTSKREKKSIHVLGELHSNRTLYAMVFPAVIFFLIFSYLPIVGIYYAFTNYNFVDGLFGSKFVGLKNFRYLFNGGWNAPVWRLTKNTILYNVVFIALGNIAHCFVAIMLTELRSKRFRKITQSSLLLPHFVSYVIVGTIAYNLFSYEFGMMNHLREILQLEKLNLYSNPNVWPFIITAFYLWKGMGYGTVVYVAAIMGIDREIYEAARIDGCGVFGEIRHITLPLLKPTFIMLVLFSLGGIVRGQFELFYQIIGRNGLLYATTDILDTYIYRALTVNLNIGLSTAGGLYQSIFGLVCVLTVNLIIKKKDPSYALF
ncbi:MAG: ABC transporter permease subunit [Candidatus Limiplasma sp.]|nr:ABC transporter permease subunit [Candidatus Limiplasma sp.]